MMRAGTGPQGNAPSPSKPHRMRTWFSLVLVVLCASTAMADKADDIAKAAMEKQHIPGLSMAVVRDGKVVKAAGYGFANLEWKVPAAPDTVYQLQSVTKQFTATAVMMLVEEGKVALDDPIGKYLEGTPETWNDSGITSAPNAARRWAIATWRCSG